MILLALLIVFVASQVEATTYYVATTGNDTTGTGAVDNPWRNPQKCVASGSPLVAGDTCSVGPGTYGAPSATTGRVITIITPNAPVATAANPITIKSSVLHGAILEAPNTITGTDCAGGASCNFAGVYISGRSYYIIEGFQMTRPGSNYGTGSTVAGVTIPSASTGIIIRRNHFHDIARNVCNNGILGNPAVFSYQGTNLTLEYNVVNKVGRLRNGESGCSTTIFQHDHGFYIENSTDLTIRYNVFYDVNRGFPINLKARSAGTKTFRARIYNNTISGKSPTTVPRGQIAVTNTFDDILIRNNILHDPHSGQVLWWNTNSVATGAGLTASNNITDYNGNNATFCSPELFPSSGVTCSSNTFNATLGFTDSANGDFTLGSTSGAINAGVNVGLAYSGSAPDMGAYETFTRTGASINGHTITVTTDAVNAPLQTSGTTGWSASCTGTGCGTPVVNGLSALVGQSTTLQFDITGITGGNCAAGQTWTISRTGTTHPVTDSVNIGANTNQYLHGFTNYSVTNACDGSPPTPPSGVTIHYDFDENTGTTATDSEGGDQDGTLTGGATWGPGISGSGVVLTAQSGQHVAIPYGNAVDLDSQDLTIAFWINIAAGTEGLSRSWFGAPLGTDRRLFIAQLGGQVRIGIKDSNASLASDLGLTSGWHHACLTMNATSKVATMHLDGVAATASGGVKSYAGGYTLDGDFDLGQIAGLDDGAGGTFEEFFIYPSVESCADIMAASSAPVAEAGSFTQLAFRFEGVRLNVDDSVDVRSANNVSVYECVEGGAVAVTLELQCDDVSDCDSVNFPLYYSTDGSNFNAALPNVATSDGVYFYGDSSSGTLNRFTADGPLVSALTHVDGGTTLSSSIQQNYDLAQNRSLTVRYLIRFLAGTSGQSYWFRAKLGSGTALGTYTATPRVNVVSPRASGGF